jgi:hypothetical protein
VLPEEIEMMVSGVMEVMAVAIVGHFETSDF